MLRNPSIPTYSIHLILSSIYLPIYTQSTIHRLSLCALIHLSIHTPTYPPIHLSAHHHMYLGIPSIHPSNNLPFIHLLIHPFIYVYANPTAYTNNLFYPSSHKNIDDWPRHSGTHCQHAVLCRLGPHGRFRFNSPFNLKAGCGSIPAT